MTEPKRPEINLEMCSGFFRIPTDSVIYNITVLPLQNASTTQVVEKIIEVEKIVEVEKLVPAPPAPPPVPVAPPQVQAEDDYFPRCARLLQEELARIAAPEAGTVAGGTGGADAALRDLAAMAGEVSEVLRAMKRAGGGASGGASGLAPALELLGEKIAQAVTLGAAIPAEPMADASAPGVTVTRHLFNLDAVFQTMYELCTNETVKAHIQSARARVGEIFNYDGFIDTISPKVSGYAEDDGFLNVPMTDIYTALAAVCSEKTICNLLGKMDKQQGAIFLDQFLPLEVPPTEEVTVAVATPSGGQVGANPELAVLLAECQTAIDALIYQAVSQGEAAPAGGSDLGDGIDEAMTIVLSIQQEAQQLADSLGAGGDDAARGGLLALAAQAQAMLAAKAADPGLSFAQGLAAGQAAAEGLKAPPARKAVSAPPPEAPKPSAGGAGEKSFGEASQDDIDRLLEELG